MPPAGPSTSNDASSSSSSSEANPARLQTAADDSVFGFVNVNSSEVFTLTDGHILRAYLRTHHAKKPYCKPISMMATHASLKSPQSEETKKPKKPSSKKSATSSTACIYSRCKTNPNCLNHLGQKEWCNDYISERFSGTSSEISTLERYARRQGLPSLNPHSLVRDPESAEGCGLRNLSATCYLNSLLQVWFHNRAFRDGVYRVRFPDGENVDVSRYDFVVCPLTYGYYQRLQQISSDNCN